MRASFWASTDDCSSIVAGNMHIMPMMPGMMNAMASAMVALMMVMPSLCGRDRERKSDDRE